MKNYIQPGEVADITPAAAVNSGDVVVIGNRIAIATVNIAAGATGAGQVEGVYSLPFEGGALPQGTPVYWSTTDKKITGTATGNVLAGYLFVASQASDTTAAVKINA